MDDGDVQFAEPPVRTVILTVYFRAIEALQVLHLSRLRELWRDDYPATAGLPPLRPHPRAGVADDDADVPSWPFPYLIFSTTDEHESVAVQSDRLVRTWEFSEGASYPGFDDLSADLMRRFEQFRDVVRDELDEEVVVTNSDCFYVNELPNMAAADLLVGVASEWGGDAAGAQLPGAHYSGLRMHIDDIGVPDCRVELMLDIDLDGASLNISSRFSPAMSDNGTQDPVPVDGGLTLAHEALIKTFLRFTSEEMQAEWGRSS